MDGGHSLERPVLLLTWYGLFEDDLGPDNVFVVEFKNMWHNSSRHAKSCDHATIGSGNIFRLRKDKG